MADKGKSWLKYGCFGCLGLVAALALIVVFLTAIAMFNVRSEKVEDRVFTQEVPGTSKEPVPSKRRDIPETADSPVPSPSSEAAPRPTPGHVILHLSQGEFEIKPAPPGEPLRVEATYDTQSFELQESIDKEAASGWNYRVDFRQTSSSLLSPLKLLMGGSRPRVRILLPVDVPISLEAHMSEGGSEVELGGLWLTTADINFMRGGLELAFRTPLHQPMERLFIDCSMGGIKLSSLGNASPRLLKVDHSMGGLDLDLRGQWVQDANISITSSMGGGKVYLPRDVVIERVGAGRPLLKDDTEVKPPTLKLSVSSRMGELTIID